MKAFSVLASLSLSLTAVGADQVVVLSNAPGAFHTTSSKSFSAEALTQLVLNGFGLSSGSVVSPAQDDLSSSSSTSAAASPLEADLFQSLAAQAAVIVSGASDDQLASDLASKQFNGKWFPLEGKDATLSALPSVVANHVKQEAKGSVFCAGSSALCGKLDRVEATQSQVDAFLKSHSFLQSANQQELSLAKELAAFDALTGKLKKSQAKSFYIVGISQLNQLTDSSKRSKAEQLIKKQVDAFAKALDAKFHKEMSVNVVVQQKKAAHRALSEIAFDQFMSFGRMLLQADEKANATTTPATASNTTKPGNETKAANATASANVTDEDDVFYQPSLDEIERYQIALWTTVLLVSMLFLTILALCNMDSTRDSLLYAKFITDASHRKVD